MTFSEGTTATEVSALEACMWEATRTRDRARDGSFVYGVQSTRVYCRPSCPSRKPRRDRVRFFTTPAAAEAAGYRPCKRCLPQHEGDPLQERVLAMCTQLDAAIAAEGALPTLADLSAQAGPSPEHFQRVFKQTLGVTSFADADARRQERLKAARKRGEREIDAAYWVGFSASSGSYERAIAQLGMTSATYGLNGRGATIDCAAVETPLGILLAAATERGLCCGRLGTTAAELERELRSEFCEATLQPAGEQTRVWVEAIAAYMAGERDWPLLPVDVRATAFQRRVWEALRAIPVGTRASYSELARVLGAPTAARAVAGACAANPVAIAIPCHRVVRQNGELSGYRWGRDRKLALLELEACTARQDTSTPL
ncbi:O-6-methylguanine DNA methyltransferase [Rubidibacter lacunae KORDI 51-2]|uniref:methylated-DNA--[protein]-cysteine S-methyltransferase n=1 Tax=Rubidibacter lacunae KORDI 51-2 TaxID=582515 RepID=U5DP43_9CHRO|nr:methylated-DNA--[protein]-cysteine S-methyltransferase [Rubidibacter lacunae]ERN42597.1 O-6-methylguanine DNA methyltransferase [Rubidibacter lacunae KORDI 51-2]